MERTWSRFYLEYNVQRLNIWCWDPADHWLTSSDSIDCPLTGITPRLEMEGLQSPPAGGGHNPITEGRDGSSHYNYSLTIQTLSMWSIMSGWSHLVWWSEWDCPDRGHWSGTSQLNLISLTTDIKQQSPELYSLQSRDKVVIYLSWLYLSPFENIWICLEWSNDLI